MRRFREVLTTRGRAFVAAGITLTLCGWALGFSDISRVGVLLLALPVVTGVLARRQRASIRVDRHLAPARVSVDQAATVTVLLENTGTRRSPLLLSEERLDYVLGDRPRFLLGRMAPGERRQIEYVIRAHLRGRHTLGPLAVQLRDPFGLTTRFAQVGTTDEIVVLPRIDPLTGGQPAGNGIGAEGEIPHMVALHGEDDQSVREYRDGDDLRRIHWPATARTGELMVRQEDRPARRRAVILLDPRSEGHRGSGAGSSFEWAVSAVASLVTHLAGQGYAVHLVSSESVHDGQAVVSTEPDQALDLLAEARMGTDADFDDLIRAGHQVSASGGLVIAVLADRDEEALRQVASMRQPGGTGLAIVLDTTTFADGRRTGGAAAAYSEILHLAGWNAIPVGAEDAVAQVWATLTTKGVLVR
ncbi:MAG: DUF58 domain-containing protein [Lapillicoccus sp.]